MARQIGCDALSHVVLDVVVVERVLDDAVYIMRIWQATFGAKTEYDDVPF